MPNPLLYTDADFTTSGGVVDPDQLRQELADADFSSTPVTFEKVDTGGSGASLSVAVHFDTVPNATDEAACDSVIAAHDATGATPEIPSYSEFPVDRIKGRVSVGIEGAVEYTSIKAAIDAAVADGVDADNWVFIEISPGTYFEDPMTVPTGIFVVGQSHGVAVDGVFVRPNNPASSLFSIAGGICTGINARGVTGSGEACFKTTTPGVVNACTACSADGCTNGFFADGAGVSFVIANCTAVIKGVGIAITEAAFRADNGARMLGDGILASASSALLPFYTENPIERVTWADNGALISMATCFFGVAPKNSSQKGALCDNGALTVFTATTLEGPYTAMEIGSGGTDSKFVVQGSSIRSCTTDFSIQSATGLMSVSCSVDKVPVTDIVTGGVLAGTIFNTADAITEDRGPGEYRFDTDRNFPLPIFYHEETSSGLSEGGLVTDGGGLTVDVAAGAGWIVRHAEEDSTYIKWSAASGESLTASATNYVYVDSTGTVNVSTSAPGSENILLSIVVADGSGVRFIHIAASPVAHSEEVLHDYLIATRKFALNTGLAVSQGTGATKLQVASGSYYRALNLISYAGSGGDATWSYFYGTNGATEVASVTDLNTTQYDNAGTLTSMTAGYFRVDTVILTSDGRISVIYGKQEHVDESEAEAEGVAQVPTFMEESGITLAIVIVEQGVGISSIVDARPSPDASVGGGGGGGVSDHGSLSGLGDDDHTQYLLADGSRAMGGNLNMGANAITNVGNVDGVDVSDHSSRHNPGQIDALATAAASAASVGQAAAEGSAASFARSDHAHAHAAGTPVNVTKAANAEGVATTFARSDHKHDVSTGTPGSIAIGDAAAEGSATTVARSDHTHSLAAPSAPVNVTKAAASAGAATAPARADHKHDVTTAAAVAASVGQANAEGSSTSLARADHTHAHAAGTPVNVTKAANSAGAATTFARSDHKHDVTTAAPTTGIGGSNSEGSSSSLARADHNHALRTTAGPTDLTIGAIQNGEVLIRSGSTIRGAPRVYGETIAEVTSTTSTSPGVQVLQITKTASMPAGTYRLEWDFLWRRESIYSDIIVNVYQDGLGSTLLWQMYAEPQDSGSNQRYPAAGSREFSLDAASHTFHISFYASTPDIICGVSQAHMMIEYVGP